MIKNCCSKPDKRIFDNNIRCDNCGHIYKNTETDNITFDSFKKCCKKQTLMFTEDDNIRCDNCGKIFN